MKASFHNSEQKLTKIQNLQILAAREERRIEGEKKVAWIWTPDLWQIAATV